MAKKSLYEQFTDGLANAITDIREKVVEEGWFGRVVNDRSVPEMPEEVTVRHEGAVAIAEPSSTWQEKVQQAREQAGREPPEPEQGIER